MCNVPEPPQHMAIMQAHRGQRFELMAPPNQNRIVFTEELREKLAAAGQLDAAQAWVDNCNNVLHGPAK